MTDFDRHGRIKCGTIATPDLDQALADYHRVLGLDVAEQGEVSQALAMSWGCPRNAGSRFTLLQPKSGVDSFVRLVESPAPADFVPMRSFGWAAFELTVEDVHGWPARLETSGFTIVGPPKEIPGMPHFIPMQIVGPSGELLYLNEVRSDMPDLDLPKAGCPVGPIFIAILASPDRAMSLADYERVTGFEAGQTFTINYTTINKAFGLADGTPTSLSMVRKARLPILEIDDYPPAATHRPRCADTLPPANSILTLAVDDLDRIQADWLSPPEYHDGPLYSGRRSACLIGRAGELVELVELQAARRA